MLPCARRWRRPSMAFQWSSWSARRRTRPAATADFTAGAFRCVYDGVDDLRALMPDLTDDEVGQFRFRHLHRRKVLRRHGSRHGIPNRSRSLRGPGQAQQGDARCGCATRACGSQPIWGRQAYRIGGRFKFWGGLTVEAWGGGPGLVDALTKIARKDGVDIAYGARALSLLADDDGVQGRAGEAERPDRRGAAPRRSCWPAAASRRIPRWRTRYLGPRLGPGQGARHALQHRRRHPHGARHRRRCRRATGRAATRSAGTATRRNSAISRSATISRSIPIRSGMMINADGERFVDEGADFRNYTYAKYGRVILMQPGQFAWQVFDQKVIPMLRDEYRIKQVTKARADTLEELASKLEDVDAAKALETIKAYNNAVVTDIPVRPERQGRARRPAGSASRNRIGRIRSMSRPSKPMRSPAESPSPSAASRSTRAARVIDVEWRADPRPLRGGRTGRRPFLLQLSRRDGADGRGGVRPHRRRFRRAACGAESMTSPGDV